MRQALPPSCPPTHPARLGDKGVLFLGRNRNLPQRLEALKAITQAREPRPQHPLLQDIDATAPHYTPGLSRQAIV